MSGINLSRIVSIFVAIALVTACKPEIERIFPLHSEPEGGGDLTIIGKNLNDDAQISIDGSQLAITSQTKTRIDATISPGTIGTTELSVAIGKDFEEKHSFKYVYSRIVTVDNAAQSRFLPQATLNSRKQALLEAVEPLGVEVISDQPDLPTIVLGAPSQAALEAIESNENVASSARPLPIRADTAESLPVINFNWARQLPEPQGGLQMGKGTTVLVLDSGLDWRNPFFNCPTLDYIGCKVAAMVEFGPDDGMADDGSFHGTNVSAIVLSVAPGARVIGGDLLGAGTNSALIAEAIQWAITNREAYNIVAINMSISVPGTETSSLCSGDPISSAIAYAKRAGLIVVASSSNDYLPNTMLSPACSPAAVRVGATGDSGADLDKEADFSNAWVHPFMVAPGKFITAAGLRMQGTSQASPHVAGAAAVLRRAFPDASADFIVNRLNHTGPPIVSKNGLARPRRLDLFAALADQMWRPMPVPPHYEWTWTGNRDGKRPPVSDRPKLKVSINPRFASDQNTGLQWIRRLETDQTPVVTDIRRAQNYCRQFLGPIGHYRLPTRAELLSLWDWEAPRNKRLVVPELGAIPDGEVWTLSPGDSYDEEGLWVWSGENGYVARSGTVRTEKTTLCVSPIFIVPDDPPAQRFTDEGAWIYDYATGLRWLEQAGPQSDFFAATDWCTARADGGKHWRLPSAREAISILDVIKRDGSYLDRNFFGESRPRATMTDFRSDPGNSSPYEWWRMIERDGRLLQGNGSGEIRCVENLDPAASHDGVHVGDVEILGDEAAEEYQRFKRSGFREIRGNLMINGPDLPRVLLQRLERVEGSVYISNLDSADYLALPFLREVTGDLAVQGNAVREIDFRRLQVVGGNILFDDNANLGADQESGTNGDGIDAPIQLRSLQSIGGELTLSRNDQLKSFGFNQLRSVGKDVTIQWNNRLERFRFFVRTIGNACPPRGSCGILRVASNPALDNFTLPAVETIRWGIDVRGNIEMTDFSAVAEMFALYRVEQNTNLCAYDRVDGGLRASLRKRIMAEISVTGNKLDTATKRCSSRCPNEDRCELYPVPPGPNAD